MDIKSPFFKLAGIACPTASSRHRSTHANSRVRGRRHGHLHGPALARRGQKKALGFVQWVNDLNSIPKFDGPPL
jgi:hypothetical protein